ncbi:hypothetical protein [Hyphomicrobium sp. 2TAF46]|uniref:hypothetical protein n=1 Tax=Hyphomicrobium sp. 2TAF46 TaxID=3233019 RepID=UPI003F932789
MTTQHSATGKLQEITAYMLNEDHPIREIRGWGQAGDADLDDIFGDRLACLKLG